MERPLCPLCKTKHYAREAHVFASIKRETVRPVKEVAQAHKATEPLPSQFDKKAYQKLYMRGYRRRRGLLVETLQAALDGRACLLKT